MAKGRSFFDLRGGVDLSDTVVSTQWKGMLVVRSYPMLSGYQKSPAQERSCALKSMFNPMWFGTLDVLQRAKWEAYAKMSGCAHEQNKRMTTGTIGIIPRQGVLMAGVHQFVRSNMLAANSGLAYPRLEAPLASGLPPAPTIGYSSPCSVDVLPSGERRGSDLAWPGRRSR